ncbi:MAG: hypothetical protein IPO66_20160 [Rhodanobacteraceae bacterium]|nr:hypothetical protein [Rhodanobacteraceae bacterium]
MSVLALAEAPDGRLLVGSSADGAFEWGVGGLRQRVAPEQLWSNQVRAILADADGGVWYGTIQGLSRCLGDTCRRFTAAATASRATTSLRWPAIATARCGSAARWE